MVGLLNLILRKLQPDLDPQPRTSHYLLMGNLLGVLYGLLLLALGIDKNAAWVGISQGIEQNDTLLLYADGVVEVDNAEGVFYDMARLAESAKAVAARPSQWIIRAIREDVLKFQDGVAPSDDITLICIRRRT